MQNIGPIHQFPLTLSAEQAPDSSLVETDIVFVGKKYNLMLAPAGSKKQTEQCPPGVFSFYLRPAEPVLDHLLNGLLNFIARFGLLRFLDTEAPEIESFLRQENHVPVFRGESMQQLKELQYALIMAIEKGMAIEISNDSLSCTHYYQSVQKCFNHFGEAFSVGIDVLDLDRSQVYFGWRTAVESEAQLSFWRELIQNLAENFNENNGRRWVDKPWQ